MFSGGVERFGWHSKHQESGSELATLLLMQHISVCIYSYILYTIMINCEDAS